METISCHSNQSSYTTGTKLIKWIKCKPIKTFSKKAENDRIALIYGNLGLSPTNIYGNEYIIRYRQQIIARILVLTVSLETYILK